MEWASPRQCTALITSALVPSCVLKSNSVPCSKRVTFHSRSRNSTHGKSFSLTSSLRRKVCDESTLNRTWTINDELYPTIRQGRREERLL